MRHLHKLIIFFIISFCCTLTGCFEKDSSSSKLINEDEYTFTNEQISFDEFIENNNIKKSGDLYFYEEDIAFTEDDIHSIVENYNFSLQDEYDTLPSTRGNIIIYEYIEMKLCFFFPGLPPVYCPETHTALSKWSSSKKTDLSYSFTTNMSTNNLSNEEIRQAFREAADIWMSAANVYFHESTNGTINVSCEYNTEKDNAAAWATAPHSSEHIVVLNRFTTNSYSYNSIRSIFIHELGHTLGLAHEHQRPESEYDYGQGIEGQPYGEYDPDSIMHYASSYSNRLSDGDKEVIAYLYGASLRGTPFSTPCSMPAYLNDGVKVECCN